MKSSNKEIKETEKLLAEKLAEAQNSTAKKQFAESVKKSDRDKIPYRGELIQRLAILMQAQWAQNVHEILTTLSDENIEKWIALIQTPYSDLPEIEKDLRKVWAEMILGELSLFFQELVIKEVKKSNKKDSVLKGGKNEEK